MNYLQIVQEIVKSELEWISGATNSADATKGVGRRIAIYESLATLPMAQQVAIRNTANNLSVMARSL